MDSRVRIFQIGMFKCGTASIHRFYLRSGLRSVHIGTERLGCVAEAHGSWST